MTAISNLARCAAAALACMAALAWAQPTPAEALRAQHAELREALRTSVFGQPLIIATREGSDHVDGEVHAEVAAPFAALGPAFKSAAKVCEVLLLHLNVRACRASPAGSAEALELSVGPKRALAAGIVYRMGYALRIEADTSDYLKVTLSATSGPLSTRDYRIVIEAIPLRADRSFVHCSYAYGYGAVAKMAMNVYLATAGRSKIGFSVVGKSDDGRPMYVGGERGSLERNVMRYYLAVQAYLSVTSGTPQQQAEERLRTWFRLTEAYAPQLHEFDLADYLDEKHRDMRRAAGS